MRNFFSERREGIGHTGRKAEKKIEKKFKKGRMTVGSGNQASDKGDMELDIKGMGGVLFEIKATTKASYRLRYEDLCKISNEAFDKGRKPAFMIVFTNGDGSPKRDGEWMCFPVEVLRNA